MGPVHWLFIAIKGLIVVGVFAVLGGTILLLVRIERNTRRIERNTRHRGGTADGATADRDSR